MSHHLGGYQSPSVTSQRASFQKCVCLSPQCDAPSPVFDASFSPRVCAGPERGGGPRAEPGAQLPGAGVPNLGGVCQTADAEPGGGGAARGGRCGGDVRVVIVSMATGRCRTSNRSDGDIFPPRLRFRTRTAPWETRLQLELMTSRSVRVTRREVTVRRPPPAIRSDGRTTEGT